MDHGQNFDPPAATSAQSRLLPSAEEGLHIPVGHKGGSPGAFDLVGEPSLLLYVGREHFRRYRRFGLFRAPGNLADLTSGGAIEFDGQSIRSRLTLWLRRGERFSDVAHAEILRIWRKSLTRQTSQSPGADCFTVVI